MAENTNDALIDKSSMIAITDRLGDIYVALLTALETDTPGCQDLAEAVLAEIMGVSTTGAYYVSKDLRDAAKSMVDSLATDTVMSALLQSFVNSLNTHCSQRGSAESATIGSLDSFASYWNSDGDFYDMLFSPNFYSLYYAVKSSNLTPGNCYAPAIEHGAIYTNGMAKWVGGASPAFTDGAAVEQSGGSYIYAGLRPSLHVEAGGLSCPEGQTITVTVTGVGWNGAAVAETTWEYTSVGNSIAAGDYDLTDLGGDEHDETIWIRDVKSSGGVAIVASEAGQVDGTCYIEGKVPSRS